MNPTDEEIDQLVKALKADGRTGCVYAADMLMALKDRAEAAEKDRDYWKEEWPQAALGDKS